MLLISSGDQVSAQAVDHRDTSMAATLLRRSLSEIPVGILSPPSATGWWLNH